MVQFFQFFCAPVIIFYCFNFFAQFLAPLAVIAFFELSGRRIELGIKLVALPLIMGVMAVLALGIGCLIAAATVKYRDLNIIVGYT